MNDTQARKWESQRRAGALRWIATRGALAYGLGMLVVMLVGRWPIVLPRDAGLLAFLVAVALVLGTAWGAAMWYFTEAKYRRHLAARERQA